MAATYRTSAAGGGTSGTSNRTVAITTLANDLILVFCSASGNTNATPTCSDNQGGAYTLIDTALFGASANIGSWFVGNTLVGAGAATTITVATGSNTAAEIVAVAVSGMSRSGTSAIRSQGKQANQAASTTPTPVLNQSALTGNVTIGAVFNATNPATMTTPTGWTERQDVGQATPTTGLEVVTRDSGFTGTTVTWGSTSGSVFASAIVELDGSALPVTATGGATQADQTASGTAFVAVAATGSTTQDAQTAGGVAVVPIDSVGAATQTGDTAIGDAAVSSAGVTATGAATQADQTTTGSASITLVATGTASQTAQTAAGGAAVGVAVTSAATQDGQSASGAATIVIGATGSAPQTADTTAGTATIPSAVTGSATQAGDAAAGSASVNSAPVTADGTAAQDAHTASGSADVLTPVLASGLATQDNQAASGRVRVINAPPPPPRDSMTVGREWSTDDLRRSLGRFR